MQNAHHWTREDDTLLYREQQIFPVTDKYFNRCTDNLVEYLSKFYALHAFKNPLVKNLVDFKAALESALYVSFHNLSRQLNLNKIMERSHQLDAASEQESCKRDQGKKKV
jgi:hypothetical protein